MKKTESRHVGTTIRALRMAAGLSQQVLAGRVGVSPALLSLWEAGRRDPTITGLRKVAAQLGVPAALLFAIALGPQTTTSKTDEIELLDKLVGAARSLILADQVLDPEMPREITALRKSTKKKSKE